MSFRFRVLTTVLFCLCCVVTTTGPDFPRYEEWAVVARTSDLKAIQSSVPSPLGFPISQWSHGTGFFFAASQALAARWLGEIDSIRLACNFASFVFWWSMLGVVCIVSKGRTPFILLGLGLLMLGTNAGYYTRACGSETFGLATIALLMRISLSHALLSARTALLAALATAFALITRIQFAVYIVAVILIAVTYNHGLRGSLRKTRGWLCFVFFPIAGWAVIQVLFVNYWMTGAPWRSAYLFSDGQFQSLSLRTFQLGAVLFHPLHGWFVYHPFVAVALLAGAVHVIRSRVDRMAFLVGALAIGLHLWLHASWYCWWLGESFGMRGLSVASVLLVPAFIRVVRAAPPVERVSWVVASTACCIWSGILVWGEASYCATWGSFAQLITTRITDVRFFVPILASAGVVSGAFIFMRRQFVGDRAAALGAALAIMFAVAYLCQYIARMFLPPSHQQIVEISLITIATSIAAVCCLACCTRQRVPKTPTSIPLEYIILIALTGVGIFVTVKFVRLAVSAQIDRKAIDANRAGTCNLAEVRACYDEYLLIPGFDNEKAELGGFIDRELHRMGK
jgi:hypothetical protein